VNTARTRLNRYTLVMLAILLTIWYAGAAQQNGAAYLLAFYLGSLMLVSYLHARQHLRGLRLSAGSVKAVSAGQATSLPLTLTVEAGLPPTGLEITSPLAVRPLFVEQALADQAVHVALSIRQESAGAHASIPVLVRSRYPLGLFTTEILMEVTKPHMVHPKAAGNLPLPAPSVQSEREESVSSGAGNRTSGGDDFSGLRAWQEGDPLRHVHWKAVARGRPLVVKQFTGGSSASVLLDWESLDLPAAQRAGQLAKWMDEATERGLRYGMRLPGKLIKASSGAEHQRQCLDALAAQSGGETTAVTARKPNQRLKASTLELTPGIAGGPFAMLMLSITAVILPMLGAIPWTSVLVYAVALLLRWSGGMRKLMPPWARFGLILAGIGGVYLETGTMTGIEPGIAFMLILTAGKALESRTPRDVQVMAVLGWFICLCALVLEQNLTRSVYVLGMATMIAATLVRLRRGTAGFWPAMRTTLRLTAQAMPMVLLLFVFFPRGTAGIVASLTRSFQAQTGISDSLDPGSIASVAELDTPAFRVSIEGGAPNPDSLYWRCLTLSDCGGLSWRKGRLINHPGDADPGGKVTVQTITVEPHGGVWLPGLDHPTKLVKGGGAVYIDKSDHTLRTTDPLRFARKLIVESRVADYPTKLTNYQRSQSLSLRAEISPAVRALAASLRKPGATDAQVVEATLEHFRSSGFAYHLQPGRYGEAALDEFLFQRKIGFCEHYAASFGTLMRLAGIPTRLVVGYLGGEAFGDYLMVRQYNAHVWAEVHLPEKGWVRVDPTAALAPSRLRPDFREVMSGSFDIGFAVPRDAWWGRAILMTQVYWDNLNYKWFTYVVQFNQDEQSSMFLHWGFETLAQVAGWAAAAVAILLLTLQWWLKRGQRPKDRSVRLWQESCDLVAKRKSLQRQPAEAPLAFAKRVSAEVPAILPLAEIYNQHRYGPKGREWKELATAARELRRSLS